MNSLDPDLIKRAEDNYKALEGLEKYGITYLKIALDDMFNMSDVIITLPHILFKNFAWDGVTKYPIENVALLVQQINAVA